MGENVTAVLRSPTLTEFLLARIADDEAFYRDEYYIQYLDIRDKMLAECSAKRAILYYERLGWNLVREPEEFVYSPEQMDRILRDADTPCLRFLALPYADHPDYRDEWKP